MQDLNLVTVNKPESADSEPMEKSEPPAASNSVANDKGIPY